jgi:hypothetical protein
MVTPPHCKTGDQYKKFYLILESFPNISSLHFNGCWELNHMGLSDLASTLHGVRNAPLRHLSVRLLPDTMIGTPLISIPIGLKTCTVKWHIYNSTWHPGKAMKHLYAFLEPSLDTLHYLSILDYNNYGSMNLRDTPAPIYDFRALRPACTQIHRFDYHKKLETLRHLQNSLRCFLMPKSSM